MVGNGEFIEVRDFDLNRGGGLLLLLYFPGDGNGLSTSTLPSEVAREMAEAECGGGPFLLL